MDAIGGYFSLELPRHEEYHKNAIRLNTGRNCLEYILRCRQYKKVYIPYYTCEVLLEPFKKTGTEYAFYHIDLNFELAEEISLKPCEALLYTNYFGLKQRYAEELVSKYGYQLIIDNTQAFYAEPIGGIDTFYTCRKFFGVPDGAYLYTTERMDVELEQDVSYKRMAHLLKRIDIGAEAGYADFRMVDDGLNNLPIHTMSKLTQRLMESIDYEFSARRRRENFIVLHEALKETNCLAINLEFDAIPMIYPYMTKKEGLRAELICKKIFVAKYWPNVLEWCQPDDFEYQLTESVVFLPIDQRYNEQDMQVIIDLVKRIV